MENKIKADEIRKFAKFVVTNEKLSIEQRVAFDDIITDYQILHNY